MTFLSKKQIQNAEKELTREVVQVPEWDDELTKTQRDAGEHVEVLVQQMMGWQRDLWDDYLYERRNNKLRKDHGMKTRCAVLHCIDEESGEPLFALADEAWLSKKSDASLDRIFEAACRVSKLFQKQVDELVKNSESGQSDNSGCDSQPSTDAPSENSSSE